MSKACCEQASPQPPAPSGEMIRAGANGAAIAGTWTAVYEAVRVKNGEITPQEAVRATAQSAAIGAGAGLVTHVASAVARSVPILGLAALAAGVVYLVTAQQKAAASQTKQIAAAGEKT